MSDSNNIYDQESCPREQDRFLPIANVSRIMKKGLPSNAKISKDGKETVQECVSEFISFITGEASEKCQREKRKTINGDDLLFSMKILGFEEYVTALKIYLQRFRDLEGEKSGTSVGQEKEVILVNSEIGIIEDGVDHVGYGISTEGGYLPTINQGHMYPAMVYRSMNIGASAKVGLSYGSGSSSAAKMPRLK